MLIFSHTRTGDNVDTYRHVYNQGKPHKKKKKDFLTERERERESMDDPFDAPADDLAADDMFDMPVGEDDDVVRIYIYIEFTFFVSFFLEHTGRRRSSKNKQIGDDFGGDDVLGGGDDDVAGGEEKAVEEDEEEEQKEEKVDNTPKASEALLKFQADWRNRCIEMDKLAGEKKKELQAKAKEALDTFSKQRENHKSKRKATNRDNEKDFVEQIQSEKESGNSWARVVNMVDTKEDADGMDVSRMKSILIQLKSKPLKKE